MLRLLILTLAVLPWQPAQAFWSYLQGYHIGIDSTASVDHVRVDYETSGIPRSDCQALPSSTPQDPRQRCALSIEAGRSSGFGLFLEQPFRRQGLFYFKPDLGFGVRYLQAEIRRSDEALPLRQLGFSLLALSAKPYLKLGITPASALPDVFISLGPSLLVAAGKVAVNDDEVAHAVVGAERNILRGFFEFEAVLARFGEGFFSLFVAQDHAGDELGTRFYPKNKDNMSNFRAGFSRRTFGGAESFGYGAKLLLNWP